MLRALKLQDARLWCDQKQAIANKIIGDIKNLQKKVILRLSLKMLQHWLLFCYISAWKW